MSEKTKAKKLAAAKKRLKEYRSRDKEPQEFGESTLAKATINSSLHLQTDSDGDVVKGNETTGKINEALDQKTKEKSVVDIDVLCTIEEHCSSDSENNINAIEVLVKEKTNLYETLLKCQHEIDIYKTENESLYGKYIASCKNLEDLEKMNLELQNDIKANLTTHGSIFNDSNKKSEEIKTLQLKLVEQDDCISELKQELANEIRKNRDVEESLKTSSYEQIVNGFNVNQSQTLEKNQIIDDPTQMKFMYEQQIRDLQAMVKQFEIDRNQSNEQYQNYIQQLTREINALSEKEVDLNEKNVNLLGRERTLVQHISDLEKQLQQLIANQEHTKLQKEDDSETNINHIVDEKISNLMKERDEFELSYKTQALKCAELFQTVKEKNNKIEELETQLEYLNSERPNNVKLLEVIESDKVAASRALAQNEELKKQLNEVETKLIQVTNDKADLVTNLQAEQHEKKEIRSKFLILETTVKDIDEKLHFKDEEMIRLTHENNNLRTQLSEKKKYDEFSESSKSLNILNNENIKDSLPKRSASTENLVIVDNGQQKGGIATGEAMMKLQKRFTSLMTEVANLTDEKQHLEHLVLQLQGETETIGEYIALYQTQRRMLKQKEIEKETQLCRLMTERKNFYEKLARLGNLLPMISNRLVGDSESTSLLDQSLIELSKNNCVANKEDCNDSDLKEKDNNPKVVISAITDLVTDLKKYELTERNAKIVSSVDHCLCCSGKFETV